MSQGFGGQVGELDYAVVQQSLAGPPRPLATWRDPAVAGLPKLLSGELSVSNGRQELTIRTTYPHE